jgi:dTDP-4-amino-4,6-dideoxygalactose transaminase
MIYVTKPFLPPKEEYQQYVDSIWKREWLTNNGPLVNELELNLKEYLDLPHLLFLANGTVALQIAIKALELKGDIITTPFSYVATTSSIVWEGCRPVFVDIDKHSLNIDAGKIEAAVTENTSAIIATHVYGNPCDIDAIDKIARKYELKVIYDAAHCFGTKYKGKSVYSYGDISTASFHATKLFHTIEGGAVCTNDPALLKRMSFLRNFGHNGLEDFDGVGINGKNSEFHAAMGVLNLRYIPEILKRRKFLFEYYQKKLSGLRVTQQEITKKSECNYSYFPIIFENEELLKESVRQLNLNWIYPRRYFYPALSSLKYVDKFDVPISEIVSSRVLCLPLYHTLSVEEIDLIARILLRVQNN